MADVQRRPENVGNILVQVQEDLQQLKDQMVALKLSGSANPIDLHALDDALNRTELGIRQNKEVVVNLINNQVTTLPTISNASRQGSRHQTYQNVNMMESVEGRPLLHTSVYHDSPGQNTDYEDVELRPVDVLEFYRDLTMKALLNPENLNNRAMLHKNYGFALPLVKPPRQTKMLYQTVARGMTVEPLSVLPAKNRVDPSLAPPSIQEKDAKKGILSLIERGLIPPAAELTLDPSPVHHKRAPLHDPGLATRRQLLSESSARGEGSHYMASVKLDLSNDRRPSETMTSQRLGTSEGAISPSLPPSSANYSMARSAGTRSPQLRSVLIHSPVSRRKSIASSTKSILPVRVFNAPLQPLPPPATPAHKEDEQLQVLAASRNYSFFMRNGQAPPPSDPEFNAFYQRYLLQWGSIISILLVIQKILTEYSIPVAHVNGDKLAELASQFELEHKPNRDEALSVLENFEDILEMIGTPGRRYLAGDGRHCAATKIQATWRRSRDRRAYLIYRKKRWAAGVIAISWIMHVRMSRMRKHLRDMRRRHIDNFNARAKTLAVEWNRLKTSRRVIVHVPSLGYPSDLRFGYVGFDRKQNSQIGRLCDIRDPNVDVIYVSPVEAQEELKQYYCKLMGLKHAVDTSDPAKAGDVDGRFTLIVPDALHKFPTHRMCLASLLKYSPQALSRIKKLIAGRDAYYLPGVIHRDDLAVADALGIPVLGCEPEICHLYSSKSGSRRVFAAAEVQTPPGEFDVYSAQQLHELLSRLICENPDVTKWLLKVDCGFEGRFIAYIDVDKHLPCYRWMVRESLRYGEKWSKKWAQDASYNKVLAQLPEVLDRFAQPANKEAFPNWINFLDSFLSQGGIIEAYPPSDSVTCLTVDMLIDPTGTIQMTSCGDQIHADNRFKCWGTSLPQASVEPVTLFEVSLKIAEACRARGVVGNFTIDYVTFIDAKTLEQRLWATDLTLAYSDQMAMTQLMLYVTGGEFDAARCHFTVPPPRKKKKGRFKRREESKEEPVNLNRYCVMSTNLFHSNMAVVHYSVFFQMCRAHGIGFDIKERQGTVFTLVDSSKREELGMVTVGTELPAALATFARNMSIIHQEISAPNMQGVTNFKAAINDIEDILGTTEQNEKEDVKDVVLF